MVNYPSSKAKARNPAMAFQLIIRAGLRRVVKLPLNPWLAHITLLFVEIAEILVQFCAFLDYEVYFDLVPASCDFDDLLLHFRNIVSKGAIILAEDKD
jgi:hypothetical protein